MEGLFEKVKKGLAALKKPLGRLPVRRGLSPEKAGPSLKSGKKYIAWACAAALVLLLAIMPMAAGRSSEEEHQASIVSDQAQLRELETRVLGGGQLSGEAALSVTVPEGVKIEEYLVKNGDSVEEGQAIARVDPVSVMTAIASVQESLDYLSEEINALSGEADTQTVSAGTSGLVKLVYAQEGDSVPELMLDKGALAVLSLDGLMAVETETDTELSTGEKVVVSFPDGSEAEGSVKSNVEGTLIVTLEDEGYEPGTEVSLATEAGESLGSGQLYINSPWKVSAYTGDVSYVYIQAGQQVYEGQSLFGLENTGHSAEYQQLVDQRGDYEELMEELRNIKGAVHPQEILLVVDAMTGQDAVTVAESFDKELGIDGLIVTKLDGDARGGAVLSVKAVTGKPVKLIGLGEKLDALEPFHPDRMASRILGMGDILTLVEKIQSTTDLAKALEMEKKLRKDEFTLEQFLDQMQQVKKLGSLETILGLIPGMGGISQKLKEANVDEKEFDRIEAIIRSMTKKERQKPEIINGSRRKRIAAGCGMRVQDVNKLLKNFEESKKMMKRMQGMAKFASKGGFKLPFGR